MGVTRRIQNAVPLPIGRTGFGSVPAFSHDVEIRVFPVDGGTPFGHGIEKHIRVSIHTYAVDSREFYPPDTVLSQIFHQMRIVLVQVWHALYEPTFYGHAFVIFRYVRIEVGSKTVGRLSITVGEVEPIVRRSVQEPDMLVSAMVEYHIHDDFHTPVMAFGYQIPVIHVCPEPRIDPIIIGCCISMIRPYGHIVFENRIQPNGRYA